MSSANASRAPVRVVLVVGVRLYREGLASSLSEQGRLSVCGTAGSAADVAPLVNDARPDAVIVDMATPGAIALIGELHTAAPAVRLIAFAIDEHIPTIIECAEAGAHAFVTTGASLDELALAVERTLAGELLCTPRVAAELFRGIAGRTGAREAPPASIGLLTVREQQVLAYVSHGLSNKEIAASLNIAEATVKNHVHNLLEKLHVGSRVQAAARATLPAGRRRRSDLVASPLPKAD